MRGFFCSLFLSTSLLLSGGVAVHAGDEMMSFTAKDRYIVAEGGFAADTAEKFSAFLAANGKGTEAWNTVMFVSSPGGNLAAALEMGKMLREHQMSVAAYGMCASACTYMFMGGVNRVVTKGAQYGIHQFAMPDAQAEPDKPFFSQHDVEEHQALVADLHDYAKSMGIDTRVVAIASRTRPNDMTFLTRNELVTYNVENVLTVFPEGQPPDAVEIPGVTSPSSIAELELPPLEQPSGTTITAGGIAGNVAIDMVRRLIMAETLDLAGMNASMENSYAQNVEYGGRLRSVDDIMAEKRRIVSSYGVRRRQIDDATLQVSCTADSLACTVTGAYDSAFGVSEDGFISNSRWHFTYEVIAPLALPRVSVEKIEQL